jgi:hypothetical protein
MTLIRQFEFIRLETDSAGFIQSWLVLHGLWFKWIRETSSNIDRTDLLMSLSSSNALLGNRTQRKIARRLLPFLCLLYLVAYLDRANVAFAKLSISADLHFSEAVYGFGAGIFFIGYLLLEIPGALIVGRWSARRWFARILVSWGLCTVLVGFVRTPESVLSRALFAGSGGGRILPGHHRLSDALVPAQGAFSVASGFIVAIPVVARRWRPHLGIDSAAKLVRNCGLAVGLHSRRLARDRVGALSRSSI